MKSDAVSIETVHGVRQEVSLAELERARQIASGGASELRRPRMTDRQGERDPNRSEDDSR